MNSETDATAPVAAPAARPSRRWLWWLVGIGAVIVVAAAFLIVLNRRAETPQYGFAVDSPDPVADFTLDSSLGRPVSLSDFRGQHVLMYFGYTSCPDVCPTTLAEIRLALQELGDRAGKVQTLFVTVDPERDTAERLAQYVKAFNPTFIGLTGAPEAIKAVASRFGIFYEKHVADSAANYLVDHTSTVLLIDPEGRLRLVFPTDVNGQQMAEDLNRLIH